QPSLEADPRAANHRAGARALERRSRWRRAWTEVADAWLTGPHRAAPKRKGSDVRLQPPIRSNSAAKSRSTASLTTMARVAVGVRRFDLTARGLREGRSQL